MAISNVSSDTSFLLQEDPPEVNPVSANEQVVSSATLKSANASKPIMLESAAKSNITYCRVCSQPIKDLGFQPLCTIHYSQYREIKTHPATFGQQVAKKMCDKKLNDVQLAAKANLHRDTIKFYRTGERAPVNLHNFASLAKGLDVPLSFFFDKEIQKEPLLVCRACPLVGRYRFKKVILCDGHWAEYTRHHKEKVYFKNKIAELIKNKSSNYALVTNNDAATHCGIPKSTFGHYLTGDRQPNLGTLDKIATSFQVGFDHFFDKNKSQKDHLDVELPVENSSSYFGNAEWPWESHHSPFIFMPLCSETNQDQDALM